MDTTTDIKAPVYPTMDDYSARNETWKEFVAAKKSQGIEHEYEETYLGELPPEHITEIHRYIFEVLERYSKWPSKDKFGAMRAHGMEQILTVLKARPDLLENLYWIESKSKKTSDNIILNILNDYWVDRSDLGDFLDRFLRISKTQPTENSIILYLKRFTEKCDNLWRPGESDFKLMNDNMLFTSKILAARPDIVYRAEDGSFDYKNRNAWDRKLRKLALDYGELSNAAPLIDTLDRITVKNKPEPHAVFRADPKTLAFRTGFFLERDDVFASDSLNRITFRVFRPTHKSYPAPAKTMPEEKTGWRSRLSGMFATQTAQAEKPVENVTHGVCYEMFEFYLPTVKTADGGIVPDPDGEVTLDFRSSTAQDIDHIMDFDTAVFNAVSFGNPKIPAAQTYQGLERIAETEAHKEIFRSLPSPNISPDDILALPTIETFLEDRAIGLTRDGRPFGESIRSMLAKVDHVRVYSPAQICIKEPSPLGLA